MGRSREIALPMTSYRMMARTSPQQEIPPSTAYHLNLALNHTPEVASTYLKSLSGRKPPALQVPAELMEDRLFKIPKYPYRCEKVVQVIVV